MENGIQLMELDDNYYMKIFEQYLMVQPWTPSFSTSQEHPHES